MQVAHDGQVVKYENINQLSLYFRRFEKHSELLVTNTLELSRMGSMNSQSIIAILRIIEIQATYQLTAEVKEEILVCNTSLASPD